MKLEETALAEVCVIIQQESAIASMDSTELNANTKLSSVKVN